MLFLWFWASEVPETAPTALFAWFWASEVPETAPTALFAWFWDLGRGEENVRLTER